jgi:DNA-binding NtrC family response regulator
MREQTQFVAFWEDVKEPRPKFLNNFRIRPQGIKNADKRTAILVESIFEEALMKTFAIARNSNEVPVKELTPAPKPVPVEKEVMPVEMQPTFTLTFTLGTRMRELHDTIIRTVLQYTRGNRLRAAQLLQINPRTIRRRLGKKETADSVTRAA